MSISPSLLPSTPTLPTRLRDGWVALRPRQWSKNVVAFAPLLFAQQYRNPYMLLASLAAFSILCALSSAGYLVNDLLDAEKDRAHPVKCQRPIAAGRLRLTSAIILAGLLAGGALTGAAFLGRSFTVLAVTYLAISISYSLYVKHQVILDLFAIAAAFLLRGLAGAMALHVTVSPWLFLCLSLLALLLALGKRRHELLLLEENSEAHRPVLAEYSRLFLDQSLAMISAAAVVFYALYALLSPTGTNHPYLVLTVLPVLYGVLRYLYLVFHRGGGGRPEELFYSDRPLVLAVVFWVLLAFVALER